jgi:plasmid stability protein
MMLGEGKPVGRPLASHLGPDIQLQPDGLPMFAPLRGVLIT